MPYRKILTIKQRKFTKHEKIKIIVFVKRRNEISGRRNINGNKRNGGNVREKVNFQRRRIKVKRKENEALLKLKYQ